MKKLLLLISLCFAIGNFNTVFANEIEEDYLDIVANYCVIGDYDLAMDYLDKILTINPNNEKATNLKKGLSHIIAKDKKSFISAVNPSVKQAQEYKRLGDGEKELAALIEGTQGQNSYIAFYYLGNFYRDRNEYFKAIDAYNNATSAKADFAPSYLASAITLFDAEKYEAALNPIDKYLTFNPNDDFAYALKSRIEFQLGMNEQAKIDNDKALEINNCPQYLFDKAKILFKFGDFKNAKDIFVKISSDIQSSKIYEYMGYCDEAMGDYISALNNINKALILSNDDEYLENKYNEIKKHLESNNE